MSITWAVVGVGRHADNCMAPAIARAGNGRLVAVLSRDAARARAFAPPLFLLLRKLNQAYFAYHGSYANSPSSISPIGVVLGWRA